MGVAQETTQQATNAIYERDTSRHSVTPSHCHVIQCMPHHIVAAEWRRKPHAAPVEWRKTEVEEHAYRSEENTM
ncbi:hypothetical protein NDU88_006648 [Pleurodeles waltl]|uniref:Uncharacterized protein n=1 Tax=Pleurodeles waltl TaxID=8319 RepID=A0AAV7TYD9_PLEWA|nr:hypothetical protein NDU88_006648 [Pleurodeles waltl]